MAESDPEDMQGPSLLDTVERLDIAKTRLIVAPIASPSLHVMEARAALAEHETKYAAQLTPQVVQFLSVYLTNGYDVVGAAKAANAPEPKAYPSRRKWWGNQILSQKWAKEAIRLRHAADYSARRLTKERLIEELELIATANMSDYVADDWAGNPQIAFDKTDRKRMAAVAKLRTKASSEGSEREGTKRELTEITFELHDKQKAIQRLLDLYEAEEKAGIDPNPGIPFANALFDGGSQPLLLKIVPVPSGQFVPAPAEPAPPPATDPKPGDPS